MTAGPGRKVYVDTCVLSRLTDYHCSGRLQLDDVEIDALEHLAHRPELEFVTSSKTFDELLNTADREHRIVLQFLYRFLGKVESDPLLFRPGAVYRPLPGGNGGGVRLAAPAWVNAPLLVHLTSVFDPADAEHIYQAVGGSCDFFLTVDFKTILNRVRTRPDEVKRLCGKMSIVSPVGLVTALTSS